MIYNQGLLKAIQSYSEELKNLLDPRVEGHQKLVQRGMMLFREQNVYNVKFSHKKMVGNVRDVSTVYVELYFDQPKHNTCSCPEEGICRHQIALFFAILSKAQNIFVWTQEWKAHWEVEDILSTLKRGSDLLKQTSSNSENGPYQWVTRIQQAYSDILPQNIYQLQEWARTRYHRLLTLAPVEREWKPLFQLFAAFESLKIIDSISTNSTRKEEMSFFAEKMVEEAKDAITVLSATASPFAFDEYLLYLRSQSTSLLEVETSFEASFTLMYLLLWTMLFKKKQERAEEWNHLRIKKDHEQTRIQLGLIHLSILLEKDELALQKIKNYGANIAPYALSCFEWLPKERITPYISEFVRQIEHYVASLTLPQEKIQFTRTLYDTMDEDTLSKIDAALIERLYITLLPYSRFRYSEYLLNKQDYRKWAALQVYMEDTIDFIDRATLNIVAKQDPAAIKPLYHAAVIDQIDLRNRDSYKKAVRYLKKLRTIYRKEKKLDQWEFYLSTLLNRTKRLRAFQEECRKGKLVHEE
ncbi:SWIM zinc finger domain-containing protein [Lederbergia sp. NSJ-179]|uniref:SWIM zinc finger family protein n=1 Tax=Lederbergia sp. NSJ-179 TaxID=2931402 RepID=UPI001FD3AB3C|nr:SWIM zinc finger family protein [Lederbergia sp. NSJ-179]MCJ7840603.1 SWIM zinc finger domain-containing protein [Lederbergia sp. NSJ-179]